VRYVASDPIPQLKVLADIDRYTDVQYAINTNADGIGLYRSEFELLNKGRLLSENEQYDCYRYVMQNMKETLGEMVMENRLLKKSVLGDGEDDI